MRKHVRDLEMLRGRLLDRLPFTFIRFSDGEMEILRGSKLVLGSQGVEWSKGKSSFIYPSFDHKHFDPEADGDLRAQLLMAASYQSDFFFKGVPALHNKAPEDKRRMVTLNGGTEINLTYADLLINSNYRRFLSDVLPILRDRNDVLLVGNHASRPDLLNPNWGFLPVPDGVFQRHQSFVDHALAHIREGPANRVILSSASSISNILGHQLHLLDSSITFIDIGTALHEQLGLSGAKRAFQSQLMPWSPKSAKDKLAYFIFGGHRFKWR